MTESFTYKEILSGYSEKRRVHTMGVMGLSVLLAEKYGENVENARLAALFHDMYRGIHGEELDDLVLKYGLDESRYLGNANLAHGKLAEKAMELDYGITDRDVLNAVSYHTTGRAGMSMLEKIVFIADAAEPGRNYPGVAEIREALERDIDRACLLSLKGTIEHLREENVDIDKDTLDAAEYFEGIVNKG